jgi:hypothetical protein
MLVRQKGLIAAALAAFVWSRPVVAQEANPPAAVAPTASPAVTLPSAASLPPGGSEPGRPSWSLPTARNSTQPVPELVGPTGCATCLPGAACADKQPAPFTPFMFGDFTGPIINLFSAVKIAENESPRPVDRLYTDFNYYNDLNKSRWAAPTEAIHNVNLYGWAFGLEKTYLNQTVSLGMRVPFDTISAEGKPLHLTPDPITGSLIPVHTDEGFTTTLFGNISAIAKAVLWEDRASGNLISGGATISFPTASNLKIDPGQSIVAFIQPFGGYIFTSGDLFVQGFSSITIPLVHAQSIVLFNDAGVGYWLYRDGSGSGLLSGVAPTLELHLATPLRQISPPEDLNLGAGLRLSNVLDMTLGTTFVLTNGATLGVAMAVPLTGPKPFDFETLVQFNYRF